MNKLTQKIDSMHDREQVWLTRKKLQEETNWSEGKIRNLRNKKKIVFRRIKGNGGEQFQYLLSSISIETNNEQQTEKDNNTIYPQSIREVILTQLESLKPSFIENQDLIFIDKKNVKREIPSDKKEALELKNKIVDTYEHYIQNVQHGEKVKKDKMFIDILNAGLLPGCENAPQIIGRIKKIGTIVYEWKNKLERSNGDYRVLLRKQKQVKNKIDYTASAFFIGFRKQGNNISKINAARYTIDCLKEIGYPINISEKKIIRDAKSVEKDNMQLVEALTSKESLKKNVITDIHRDKDKLNFGDLVSADFTDLDNFLLDGEIWKIGFITEWVSGAIISWVFTKSENIEAVRLLISRGIRFIGRKFTAIQFDNGPAFRSHDIENDCKVLGVERVFAKPYNGQSKPQEKANHLIKTILNLLPHHRGNNILNRPAFLRKNEKELQQMQKIHYDFQLTPEIVMKALPKAVDIYNSSKITTGKFKGLTKQNVLDQNRGPGINGKELTFLMLKKVVKKSHKNGIKINGEWYINLEKMFGKERSYLVRYDPLYNDLIYLFDELTGEYLFEAYKDDKVHPEARLFGTEEEQKIVFKKIATQQYLMRESFKTAEEFHRKVISVTTDYTLKKLGLTKAEMKQASIKRINNNKIEIAEVINENSINTLLKTGTDNIAIGIVEETKPTEIKTKGWLFNKLNKK